MIIGFRFRRAQRVCVCAGCSWAEVRQRARVGRGARALPPLGQGLGVSADPPARHGLRRRWGRGAAGPRAAWRRARARGARAARVRVARGGARAGVAHGLRPRADGANVRRARGRVGSAGGGRGRARGRMGGGGRRVMGASQRFHGPSRAQPLLRDVANPSRLAHPFPPHHTIPPVPQALPIRSAHIDGRVLAQP